MAEKTKIQWTDHTFNPWIGCAKVNEGCKFCYAEQLMANRYGRVEWGPNGTRSRTKTWREPVRWNKEAARAGEAHKVFCASLADVFEDRPELVPWRADLFDLIDDCPHLNWLLLTKRPENIGRMWPWPESPTFRSNVWLGTSIATQKNLDEFLGRLTQWRELASVLFLSIEPQIGRVSLPAISGVDWVICGGESKQGHGLPRTFDLAWARQLREECAKVGIPFFFKQAGSRPRDGGKPIEFADSHGGDMAEWPAELRVRECPETYVFV